MIPLDKLISDLTNQAKNPDATFKRLYRLLYNKELYYKALCKLYSNSGTGTPGVDGNTVDGFNEEAIDKIIASLRDQSYQPKPVMRVYIPKKNGKKRPLGLPTFTDKLVQEIVRFLLEIIYEPTFSDSSHGFRPGRSCHSALEQITQQFRSVSWFIEGDIHGCFDNIDHNRLIEILGKKIKDDRFLNLIRKFLNAGYLEDWKHHKTYSGCPQGSIIGPILANIYLNEFDEFVEKEVIPDFNHGSSKDRKRNPEYRLLLRKRCALKKEIAKEADPIIREELLQERSQMGKEMLNMQPMLPNQGEFKKLTYVRYADDWLIGVIGSKQDCREIKEKIREFLKKNLKLELSKEKTLITHSDKPAQFLGYNVSVRRDQATRRCKDGSKKRVFNRQVVLSIPRNKLTEFIREKKMVKDLSAKHWKMLPRKDLLRCSDLEILTVYDSEIRGMYNYYCMANNVSSIMNMLRYVSEYSCLKTLCNKHKTSIGKFKQKHMVGQGTWGIKYRTKKGEKTATLYKGFGRKKPSYEPRLDCLPNKNVYSNGRTELEARLKAGKCEICGAENVPLELHHVNKVKNLKGKKRWEQIMIAKKRKTLALCHDCHQKIHHGKLD